MSGAKTRPKQGFHLKIPTDRNISKKNEGQGFHPRPGERLLKRYREKKANRGFPRDITNDPRGSGSIRPCRRIENKGEYILPKKETTKTG